MKKEVRLRQSVWRVAILMTVVSCGTRNVDVKNTETAGDSDTGPFTWQTADPGSVDMDSALLTGAVDFIEADGLSINSMIVVKEGRIVLEHYFDGGDENTLYNIESSTKSIVSLLVGMAIEEGLIDGVKAPVLDFFGDASFDNFSDEKAAMTVDDLLTMQSGLDYDNNAESFLDETDPIAFILGHEMKYAPGAHWAYSSADLHLLGAIIAKTSGRSLRDYATQKLFDKLGMSPGAWLQDKGGFYVAGYGLKLTARDMARVGLLMLNKGEWDGETIVSEGWIDDSLALSAETSWSRGDFGYSWWIKPVEGYCAAGRFGQQINFFPERNLVVVYTASLPIATADSILDAITRAFVLGTDEVPGSLNSGDAGIEDSCGSTDGEWNENPDLVQFASGVSTFGDEVSTRCLHSVENHTMCLSGVAADAGTDYENWGAGMALRLAETDEDGKVIAPFDAASKGIFGVRFTLSGADTLAHGLRAGMTMVDQDGVPFEYNAYVVGGSWSGDVKTDGVATIAFETLGLPTWAEEAVLQDGRAFDPAQIHSLRFQAVTQPGGAYAYDFCISDVEWLNQDLEPLGDL